MHGPQTVNLRNNFLSGSSNDLVTFSASILLILEILHDLIVYYSTMITKV